MQIAWLETLVVAAEEENFHRVAEKLHLSQPAVTVQIQKLENAWGVKLFERNGRGVALTPAAKKLLPYAKQMLATFAESQEAVARWQQGYEISLTIAASPLVATTWLPRWIRAYGRDRRDVEFSVQVVESSDMMEKVLSGECDLGFSRMDTHHPLVHTEVLYEDPVLFVVPGDDKDWDGAMPSVDEYFAKYPLFTHNHPEYWDGLLRDARSLWPGLRAMQVSQVHVTVHMIIEQMGVSFLPESTVRKELLRGSIFEVPCPDLDLPKAKTVMMVHAHALEEVQRFAMFVTSFMAARHG